MGSVFFDNSALTRLFDENATDRPALLAGLRTLGKLRLSALNVYETARTPEPKVRVAKLRFFAEVAGGVTPLADPMALLPGLARNWCERTAPEIVVDELAETFLLEPEIVCEEWRHDFSAWSKDQERTFIDMHNEFRRVLSTIYGEVGDRFRDEDQFLQMAFWKPDTIIHALIAPPFEHWTGEELHPDEVRRFLDQVAPWKTFVAAQLHVFWLRSATERVASPKRTGIFDTDSAAYLPYSDYFITNDRAQLTTMQVANGANPRSTTVELYAELRSRLLL